MHEKINEKVGVIHVYDPHKGTSVPVRIRWQGRYYIINKIGYIHKEKQGRVLMHYFQVTDGSISFKLRFDTEGMTWTLEEVSDGLAT